jgi:hypothetical protein
MRRWPLLRRKLVAEGLIQQPILLPKSDGYVVLGAILAYEICARYIGACRRCPKQCWSIQPVGRSSFAAEIHFACNDKFVLRIRSRSFENEHLAASALSVDQMDDLLDALAAAVVEVYPSYLWRAQLRDPDDDMVLEAAINGRANAIVTFDVRDFGVVPERFNIRALRPGDALAGLVK